MENYNTSKSRSVVRGKLQRSSGTSLLMGETKRTVCREWVDLLLGLKYCVVSLQLMAEYTDPKQTLFSFFHSFILSFFHSFILSFFHSFILSFFHLCFVLFSFSDYHYFYLLSHLDIIH